MHDLRHDNSMVQFGAAQRISFPASVYNYTHRRVTYTDETRVYVLYLTAHPLPHKILHGPSHRWTISALVIHTYASIVQLGRHINYIHAR